LSIELLFKLVLIGDSILSSIENFLEQVKEDKEEDDTLSLLGIEDLIFVVRGRL
jgi:hypothetical protein